MMWNWSPQSSGSSYDLIKADGAVTDFRLVAYELHDYIEEYRAAHRGTTVTLNTPTLFFNKGNGTVEWVKPTQNHTYKLERSDNGGGWKTIATSGATVDAVGRKYIYKDTALPTSGTVQYRVTAIAGGVSVSSVSNTVEVVPPAVNLVKNYSFESSLTGWQLFGSNGTYRVSNTTARTGSYSLELDYGSTEWQGVNQPAITVKPHTNYVLTYYYKNAPDDTANNCYCFVRGVTADGKGDGSGTIYDEVVTSAYMNGGNTTEWKKETLIFRTGDSDKLGVDFRVVKGTHVYIDDVELYEVQ
jgi:hypothetical protein